MRGVIQVAVLVLLAHGARAGDLALRRVMLSSAGVGYFEYTAEVEGPATLGLDVPLAQVDDVLKSLVVFDDAGGVGTVDLPGRDQSHTAFGNVPFGPEGFGSPLAFLNSLQGVEVTVQGPRAMAGRIMTAEIVQEAAGAAGPDGSVPMRARTRVSVLTDEGLKQFVLEDSEAVQVNDPTLRTRIGSALAALLRESGQDTRHVTIRVAGGGHRIVRVGYVAVAPLWKASYRLVLPQQDADPAHATARMQGWATLENQTGTDWNGVALTLQYGNPVTFHQAIYQSYYVQRPEVPVEVLGRLLPDVDTRAYAAKAQAVAAPPPPPPEAAPEPPGYMPPPNVAPQRMMARPAEATEVVEGAEETVFVLPKPITLAAGHSASVPILDRDLPAVRIALAQENEPHPRAAIRLRNTTPQSLPAGVLTLYDDQAEAPYAGDARLGGLPSGEDRLLSFAQDLRTGVDWLSGLEKTLVSVKAVNGVLTVTQRMRAKKTVTITAPAHERRHVLLEMTKDGERSIPKGFPQPTEETAEAWRFGLDLKEGEVRTVILAADETDSSTVAVEQAPDTLVQMLNEDGASDAVRAALQHIADLRQAEAARAAARDQLVSQRQGLETDEQRLRANLGAVQQGDSLHARLLHQLESDETRYGQLATAIDGADAAVASAHKALLDAINALDF